MLKALLASSALPPSRFKVLYVLDASLGRGKLKASLVTLLSRLKALIYFSP